MEEEKMNNMKSDYDKEPIVIINYSVLFERYLIALLLLIGIPLLIGTINKGVNYENNLSSLKLVFEIILTFYLVYIVFIQPYIKFKNKKSFFIFKKNSLEYNYKYLTIEKNDIHLSMDINEIKSISHCIVCELPESYGRWHYLTSWQLYRKSSIGVHIGKLTLFIRYLITFIIFILPQKIWRLYKSGESYSLLSKNLFIQFNNRNYFLVNIYSQSDLDILIKYFSEHNILITDKTYFIPHLQDQGWFVDKEEIWTTNLNKDENNG